MTLKAKDRISVFLCHASPDKEDVKLYYDMLLRDGYQPWIDEENLLPGEQWREVIPEVVRRSDVVIVFLSSASTTKEGFVQKEIKLALDVEEEKPEGTIFLIPAKLEDCSVPKRLSPWQWVNLYKEDGYQKLLSALSVRANSLRDEDTVRVDPQAANYEDEDSRVEWLIYQVAFLWHGLNPPPQGAHWNLMTRQIEDTKMMLHNAVDDGKLEVTREIRAANGVTRYVSRNQLRKFAESIGQKPDFLFPESRNMS